MHSIHLSLCWETAVARSCTNTNTTTNNKLQWDSDEKRIDIDIYFQLINSSSAFSGNKFSHNVFLFLARQNTHKPIWIAYGQHNKNEMNNPNGWIWKKTTTTTTTRKKNTTWKNSKQNHTACQIKLTYSIKLLDHRRKFCGMFYGKNVHVRLIRFTEVDVIVTSD